MTRRVVSEEKRTFRMNGKSGSIDWFISNHYISMLIHKNKIRDTNLGEVLGKWIKPEVICQYWVTDRATHIIRQLQMFSFCSENSHVPSNSLIKASLRKSAHKISPRPRVKHWDENGQPTP